MIDQNLRNPGIYITTIVKNQIPGLSDRKNNIPSHISRWSVSVRGYNQQQQMIGFRDEDGDDTKIHFTELFPSKQILTDDMKEKNNDHLSWITKTAGDELSDAIKDEPATWHLHTQKHIRHATKKSIAGAIF